jgi:hypothetical protein
MLKTIKQHRIQTEGQGSIMGAGGGFPDLITHNTGIISRQKSQWTMNRHLNNKGKEQKIGYTKGEH